MNEPKIITMQVEAIDHVATGGWCRDWRTEQGPSGSAVAAKLGISAAMISDLERGRRNWTAEKLEEYIDAVKALAAHQPKD